MHIGDKLFLVFRRYGPPYNAQKPLEAQPEWKEHRAFINRADADGLVRLAGPLGDIGEVLLIVRAADQQQVERCLATDPWTRSGILSTTRIVEWHLRHGEVR